MDARWEYTMDWLRNHWITTLAVLLGLFLAFLAYLFAADSSNPEVSAQEQAFGVTVMGLTALALFGGVDRSCKQRSQDDDGNTGSALRE